MLEPNHEVSTKSDRFTKLSKWAAHTLEIESLILSIRYILAPQIHSHPFVVKR